jgi:hypothetical protein
VVAVVRVRVSNGGRLLYGEVIDARSERIRRFASWTDLVESMNALIGEAVGGRSGDDAAAEPSELNGLGIASEGDERPRDRRQRP